MSDRVIFHIDVNSAFLSWEAVDRIGHGERFLLVMGDIDECDARPLLDVFQFVLHVLAQLQIECAKRFVKQKNAGLTD